MHPLLLICVEYGVLFFVESVGCIYLAGVAN